MTGVIDLNAERLRRQRASCPRCGAKPDDQLDVGFGTQRMSTCATCGHQVEYEDPGAVAQPELDGDEGA